MAPLSALCVVLLFDFLAARGVPRGAGGRARDAVRVRHAGPVPDRAPEPQHDGDVRERSARSSRSLPCERPRALAAPAIERARDLFAGDPRRDRGHVRLQRRRSARLARSRWVAMRRWRTDRERWLGPILFAAGAAVPIFVQLHSQCALVRVVAHAAADLDGRGELHRPRVPRPRLARARSLPRTTSSSRDGVSSPTVRSSSSG